ncbi:MAG TPA: hypothetical protein VGL61_17755 [Kofleriaceae bacterium]
MLARVQRGLEALYRVDTGVAVDDFVIDEAARDAIQPERRPREQLLVCEEGDGVSIALFVDPAAIANLVRHDPGNRLGDHNLGDFLLAIEGVSHFIYAIWCARAERRVTQLELELQAEVDKYVTCLLVTEAIPRVSAELRARLFGDPCYEPDLDADERERYRAANDNAHRYTTWLEHAFVAPRRIPEMLGELRRFYRVGLAGKLAQIATLSRAA